MASSNSQLPISNVPYVEALQERFLDDPSAVPEVWRRFFGSARDLEPRDRRWRRGPSFRPANVFGAGDGAETALFQDRVDQLVRAYRVRGHMVADIDPLGLPREVPIELEPGFYGLGERDLDRRISSASVSNSSVRTLRHVIEHLQRAYCRSIGVQYMHIDDLEARWWLRDRMEDSGNSLDLARDEQLRILTRLIDAVMFEEFIQKKFVGAKSFSLEGAESLIPLLDLAIERASFHGVDRIVLGMAHRGRLNVLANILGKSPRDVFAEFEDRDPYRLLGGGDVKYHLGHSTEWTTAKGRAVQISLCFNPSHVEFVNPVALGLMRAAQDRLGDDGPSRGLVVLIHGDAAFAGEGIVQETLNLSELEAYTVGGALHVVVNNQLGFTTPPEEGRSSMYATAVAKMLQVPIFHVNGEHPEAVAQVIRIALDFRTHFRRDVVVDMYCYRRRGHNETDEPSFTQPVMYRAIGEHRSVRDGYLGHLIELGAVSEEETSRVVERRRSRLEDALREVRSDGRKPSDGLPDEARQSAERGESDAQKPDDDVASHVEITRLTGLLERLSLIPPDLEPHPKIRKFLSARLEMSKGERPLDWSAAEALAFATLATEGRRIRLSGQDSERGTFSQRHAVLHDQRDGHPYRPLQHLADDQAPVEILNSPLSEAGVLGYEYGYSLDCPNGLVLWEAQFGDFANAAQVMIDEFVSSGEDKWSRLSGLVLLLPHGFEGMGPEHSSARLERFLTLAAEENIRVVFPTTPAQYFHVLRRHSLRRRRRPLVVLTPKSMLRNSRAVSSLEDLASGSFRKVIPDHIDEAAEAAEDVERVILCSGKIYWELVEEREKRDRSNVRIVRIEEVYPFPWSELEAALSRYPDDVDLAWVQEEPENMGAWRYVVGELSRGDRPGRRLSSISRPASASPATGSASSHRLEQGRLLAKALGTDHEDVNAS